jgi:hypothetical protein
VFFHDRNAGGQLFSAAGYQLLEDDVISGKSMGVRPVLHDLAGFFFALLPLALLCRIGSISQKHQWAGLFLTVERAGYFLI